MTFLRQVALLVLWHSGIRPPAPAGQAAQITTFRKRSARPAATGERTAHKEHPRGRHAA